MGSKAIDTLTKLIFEEAKSDVVAWLAGERPLTVEPVPTEMLETEVRIAEEERRVDPLGAHRAVDPPHPRPQGHRRQQTGRPLPDADQAAQRAGPAQPCSVPGRLHVPTDGAGGRSSEVAICDLKARSRRPALPAVRLQRARRADGRHRPQLPGRGAG